MKMKFLVKGFPTPHPPHTPLPPTPLNLPLAFDIITADILQAYSQAISESSDYGPSTFIQFYVMAYVRIALTIEYPKHMCL